MPNELTHLTLTELSLVDNPANPLAMAPIFKANTPNGEDMTETTEKMAPEMEAKTKLDAMTKENERLRKGLLDAGYVIKADAIEKKVAEEYVEYEGEKIAKSTIPTAILKKLETDAQEKQEAAIQKKASETFPNLKEDLAVALVKADFDEDLMAALAALDELFGGQMDEIGKSDTTNSDMADPSEKLNALAKKYAEEHEMTFAKAYTAVVKTDAGKALVKETYKKD